MRRMDRASFRVSAVVILLIFPEVNSVDDVTKLSLIQFMVKLSPGNDQGWSLSTDPCSGQWKGVTCDSRSQVKMIILEALQFTGTLDARTLCSSKSLAVLSLKGNALGGEIPQEIGDCDHLTHLYLGGNQFSGQLPDALSRLNNLKRLDISDNNFMGPLPDLARISGMITFLAQNNNMSGALPQFDFANFQQFNVSNNNFTGQIPDVAGHFQANSFWGNPGLCGPPLPNPCPATRPNDSKPKDRSRRRFLTFLGYILLGAFILLLLVYQVLKRTAKKRRSVKGAKDRRGPDTRSNKSCNANGTTSSEPRMGENRSEYSLTSVESRMTSSSLTVLSNSPVVKDLRFEDLLRAPAKLLGRGKHGTLYKVMLNNGVVLVVKRIRDCRIHSEEFKMRMHLIDRAKHPNVLRPVAFYCSKQEKLLVYEYQPNGSLFSLLHGEQKAPIFDWGSRLRVAVMIAEALAFMHSELQRDGISHGNLKSTNILVDEKMDPRISEYGLMEGESQDCSDVSEIRNNSPASVDAFRGDVYGLGVILLELLTGKMVQNNGYDLAKWVHSMVQEEWTGEVFDRALVSEGANEERMVRLLQVALKCISPSADERPTANQVTATINSIKEEEERSVSSEL